MTPPPHPIGSERKADAIADYIIYDQRAIYDIDAATILAAADMEPNETWEDIAREAREEWGNCYISFRNKEGKEVWCSYLTTTIPDGHE